MWLTTSVWIVLVGIWSQDGVDVPAKVHPGLPAEACKSVDDRRVEVVAGDRVMVLRSFPPKDDGTLIVEFPVGSESHKSTVANSLRVTQVGNTVIPVTTWSQANAVWSLRIEATLLKPGENVVVTYIHPGATISPRYEVAVDTWNGTATIERWWTFENRTKEAWVDVPATLVEADGTCRSISGHRLNCGIDREVSVPDVENLKEGRPRFTLALTFAIPARLDTVPATFDGMSSTKWLLNLKGSWPREFARAASVDVYVEPGCGDRCGRALAFSKTGAEFTEFKDSESNLFVQTRFTNVFLDAEGANPESLKGGLLEYSRKFLVRFESADVPRSLKTSFAGAPARDVPMNPQIPYAVFSTRPPSRQLRIGLGETAPKRLREANEVLSRFLTVEGLVLPLIEAALRENAALNNETLNKSLLGWIAGVRAERPPQDLLKLVPGSVPSLGWVSSVRTTLGTVIDQTESNVASEAVLDARFQAGIGTKADREEKDRLHGELIRKIDAFNLGLLSIEYSASQNASNDAFERAGSVPASEQPGQ